MLMVTGYYHPVVKAEEAVSSDNIVAEEDKSLNEQEVSEKLNVEVTEREAPIYSNKVISETFEQGEMNNNNGEMNFDMPEADYIAVEDIEASEFKDKMFVEETQNISPTAFPTNATCHDFSYTSTDQSVANVDRLGKITAVGSGSCSIIISCGEITVSYGLTVKMKTEAIIVKSKYIVLKPGQQFGLNAAVKPAGASQSIKFKSKNENIASVDGSGTITANNNGSTTIIISNDDYTTSVNVIVNTDGKSEIVNNSTNDLNNNKTGSSDQILNKIRNSKEDTIVVGKVSKISSEVLEELYGTEITLIIECDDYDILLNGKDILNAENELITDFDIEKTEKGFMVFQSQTNKLPGKISIRLKGINLEYKYVYLCSEDGKEIKRINALTDKNTVLMTSTGRYLLCLKKAEKFKINIIWILGAAGVILIMSVIYIFSKRKYWFW